MARMIDADKLKERFPEDDSKPMWHYTNVHAEIDNAPTAVIHCKDCRWWTRTDEIGGRCSVMRIRPTGDWYCGSARRRMK